MTFQEAFVLEKLSEISGYLEEIKNLFECNDKEILKDSVKLHSAERLLQLTVDTILDVNQHFIREMKLKISDDFQGTFYILGENKILPKDFARKIAPVVGLRNRIVHRYETLDKKIFISTFRKDYSDFKKYLRLISTYLDKIE
ncbi:MAG: DUF86 domain-containing protein [Candidatus Moranbacteria bacterium]|nr:DUF86 domain-containing protein [Candidatus Moranbacteria bacterium]